MALLAAVVVGCQSVGYYKQAFSGQLQMLSNQQPIKGLIDNPDTSSKLKEKFRLILSLRQFAEKHLNLPAGDHYLSYIDLHRSCFPCLSLESHIPSLIYPERLHAPA